MDFVYNQELQEKKNITKTGYRALFLLMQLIQQPLSRDELLAIFEQHPIINKDFSKDTITNTINTLRKAGCIISRPSLKTDHKYVLKSHPFHILLDKKHIDALQTFREGVISDGSWQQVLHLNNLYAKLAKLAGDEISADILKNNHPFNKINIDILNEIIIFIKTRKKAKFLYLSPENGEEELDFSPEKITFENQKLYVWGHNLKYDDFGYLRIDKIKKILTPVYNALSADDYKNSKQIVEVEYLLKGYSAQTFICNDDEEIIKTTESELLVKARVRNKFYFYQRILAFGTECRLLSPQSVREEFLRILKDIKAGYKDAG